MPLVYRKKTCPNCGTEHRKRGPYCSRSCGNHRTHTEERKQQISKATTAWLASGSETAEVAKWTIAQQGNSGQGKTVEELMDDYPVPPTDPGLGRYEVDTDGDIWFES